MATEAGLKSHKVHYVCDLCIEKAEQKKEFSRFLSTPRMENDSVAEVPKFHSVSNPSFSYFDSQEVIFAVGTATLHTGPLSLFGPFESRH